MDKGTELFDASHELRGTSLICQAASLLAADAPLDEIFERLSGLLATHVDASAVFVASILSGYVIWGNTPEEWAPGGSSPIYRERPGSNDAVSAIFVPMRAGGRTIGALLCPEHARGRLGRGRSRSGGGDRTFPGRGRRKQPAGRAAYPHR